MNSVGTSIPEAEVAQKTSNPSPFVQPAMHNSPMVLTPIHVPGKSKRDQSKAGIAATKALKRKPGRPPNLKPSTTNLQETTVCSKPHIRNRSLKNIKSRRKMSHLERLPTEILQTIYLYCQSIELPRSSPVIGGKLSSELIYIRTLMLAFGPTWEMWPRRSILEVPIDVEPGDSELQSTILCCRWASLPLIQKAQTAWIQKYAPGWSSTPQRSMLRHILPLRNSEESDSSSKSLQECFEEDFAEFTNSVQLQATELSHDGKFKLCRIKNVADDVEIPSSLLLGPWNEEMTRRLFWLVHGSARVSFIRSTSGEMGRLGLRRAVAEGNHRLIHLLVWAGIHPHDPGLMVWALRNAGGDPVAVINQLISTGLGANSFSKFAGTLEIMGDKAVDEGDKKKLFFYNRLVELPSVKHRGQFKTRQT